MIPSNNHKRKYSPQQQRHTRQPLYQPSIYSFTCRGAYHVSSTAPQRQGRCRGLQSQLELVSDEFNVMTREWALRDFEQWVNGGVVDDGGGASQYPLNGETEATQTKSFFVPPMVLYKEKNPHENENPLPAEELMQKWSCYGSTAVDYLVLKNVETDEETIAAVAPQNVGLSIRDIHFDPETRTSMVQLGWLALTVQSTTTIEEEEESNKQEQQQQKQQQPNGNTDMMPSEELPPLVTSRDAIEAAQESAQRVWNFSGKVAQHVKGNSLWLYENVKDDFPARTAASGRRILHQIPKTVEQTGSVLKTLVSRLMNWDDDADADDKRGRRR